MFKVPNPPVNPGVYLFKDAAGQIIYVGKAKSLKNRVRSYFGAIPADQSKTRQLVTNIADAEYIITDNELEALILESILIKKHKPRYNIRLRDDKNYQFIKIDYSLEIPQVYSVRKKEENLQRLSRAKYFGPYTSGLAVRTTISFIKKIFPYCQAKEVGTRPCFNYQLHRCPGVCIGEVSPEQYKETFKQIEVFLHGHTSAIEKELKQSMKHAAKRRYFEKAAALRDQLHTLDSLKEEQKIVSIRPHNQDYIALWRHKDKAVVNLFVVRGGRLVSRENMVMENLADSADGKVLAAFMESYYMDATNLPNEIFLEADIEDKGLYEKLLSARAKELELKRQRVKIKVPKFGMARELIKLSKENAKNFLEQQWAKFEKEEVTISEGLKTLQKILNLPDIPKRIECYDISNISGKSAVGSMVVMCDGKPAKQHYRKFKIRGPQESNDFKMMQEVLARRVHNDWPKPDLWVIDGGRGQLTAAVEIREKFDINVPVVALAKDRKGDKGGERIFVPGTDEPIILQEGSPALTLIQRLRDEAHRFAITYHRDVRSRELFNR